MNKPLKYMSHDLERVTRIKDFARAQRARGFEVRARAAEELAELIRNDRGGL